MKLKLPLLILSLFSLQLISQNNLRKKDKIIFKNSISEKSTYKVNLISNEKELLKRVIYNKNGAVIKEENFKVTKDTLLKRNGFAYILQKNVHSANANYHNKIDSLKIGEVHESFSFEYNQNKKIKKLSRFVFRKKSQYETYEYNKNRLKAYIHKHKPSGSITSTQKLKYNNKNSLIKITRKLHSKFPGKTQPFNNYNIGEKLTYNKDGKVIRKEIFNYYGQSVALEKYSYPSTKSIIKEFYFIDNKFKNKDLFSTTTDVFNDKNSISKKEIIYTTLNEKEEINYTYDDKNNPIEEITFKNRVPLKKLIYEYKYFKEHS